MSIEDIIRPEVRALRAYRVEKTSCLAKLDANESPFSLPRSLQAELCASLANVPFHRYPDPDAERLRKTIASRLHVSPSLVMVGNGSDELIQILLFALGEPGATVLSPIPTFSMYELTSRALGLRFQGIPLGSHFQLDLDHILEIVQKEAPKLVFLASPNNPTGNCFAEQEILAVAEATRGLVVADEAYFPYSRRTVLPSLEQHENLVVLRSLSKVGLAGLRVGFLIASERLLAELNKVRLPYNVNVLSQWAAELVLSRWEAIEPLIEEAIKERDRLYHAMAQMPEVEVFPSEANFLLFRTRRNARLIYRSLLEEGVLIRDLSEVPGLERCLRVTVGTPQENDLFLESLTKSVKKMEGG